MHVDYTGTLGLLEGNEHISASGALFTLILPMRLLLWLANSGDEKKRTTVPTDN